MEGLGKSLSSHCSIRRHVHNSYSCVWLPTLAGDLNATSADSSILALLTTWRLNTDDTTTRSKAGPLSNHSAIDYLVANSAFLDYHPTTCVNYEAWFSDHYPLVTKWLAPTETNSIRWRWPKPMPIKPISKTIPWPTMPTTTYVTWAEKAVRWLAASTDTPPSSKTSLLSLPSSFFSRPFRDHTYTLFLRAQKWCRLAALPPYNPKHTLKLRRVITQLGLTCPEHLNQIHSLISAKLNDYLQHLQEEAIKRWKKRACSWSVAGPEIFAFLRNRTPKKAVVMEDELGVPKADPNSIFRLLDSFWTCVESWPSEAAFAAAQEKLHDHYAIFLPSLSHYMDLRLDTLVWYARHLKKSAPGPDRWARHELSLLPKEAWNEFLALLPNLATALQNTLLGIYRRVPIDKEKRPIPLPQDFRP